MRFETPPLTFLFTSAAALIVSHGLAIRAQSAAVTARMMFDAASVKVAIIPEGLTVSGDSFIGPGGDVQRLKRTGGPGTRDPGGIHYPLVTLRQLLNLAWEGSYSEIRSPDWLDTRAVAIDATMPAETTREQFREMLRNLLIDRFKLKYHVQAKEGSAGYYVVVPDAAPKKVPVETMVVDHMEKIPTGN